MDTNKQNETIDIIFLDYDGVINTDKSNFNSPIANPEAIYYLNALCKENNLKIVISSSWKRYVNYHDLFYDSGIDKKIEIVGSTDITNQGKTYEITKYLTDHPEVNKYLIIDDEVFSGELGKHQVHTAFSIGFSKNKYEEALEKLKSFENKN